jgi:hypothetical protein
MRRECYKDVGRISDDFRHKKKIISCERAKKFRANFFSYDASASRAYTRRSRPIRANEIRLGEIVTRVVRKLFTTRRCDPESVFLPPLELQRAAYHGLMLQRLPVLLTL